jgi:hypothetical protein
MITSPRFLEAIYGFLVFVAELGLVVAIELSDNELVGELFR